MTYADSRGMFLNDVTLKKNSPICLVLWRRNDQVTEFCIRLCLYTEYPQKMYTNVCNSYVYTSFWFI